MTNKTALILNAAKNSLKLGLPTGLLPYEDSFWIIEQLNRVSITDIFEVYIILDSKGTEYFDAIPWLENAVNHPIFYKELKIRIVFNSDGISDGLKNVLKKVESGCTIFYQPISRPFPKIRDVQNLLKVRENALLFSDGDNNYPIKMTPKFWKGLLYQRMEEKDVFLIDEMRSSKVPFVRVRCKDSNMRFRLNSIKEYARFMRFNKLAFN